MVLSGLKLEEDFPLGDALAGKTVRAW